jgi:hypothetical protein
MITTKKIAAALTTVTTFANGRSGVVQTPIPAQKFLNMISFLVSATAERSVMSRKTIYHGSQFNARSKKLVRTSS